MKENDLLWLGTVRAKDNNGTDFRFKTGIDRGIH
jgi:hypothetical protein